MEGSTMNLPKDAIYGVDLEPDAHLFFSWVLNEETKIKFTHFEVLRRVLPEGEQPGPYDACMMLPVSPPFHSLIPEDLLYDELLIHLFQQGNETQQTENVRQEDTGAPAPEAPSTDQEQAEAKASNEKERTSTETPQQAEAAPHAAPSQQQSNKKEEEATTTKPQLGGTAPAREDGPQQKQATSADQEQAEAKASNEKERTSTETPQQAEAAPHAAPSQQQSNKEEAITTKPQLGGTAPPPEDGAQQKQATSADQEQAEAKARNEKERTSTETPQQAIQEFCTPLVNLPRGFVSDEADKELDRQTERSIRSKTSILVTDAASPELLASGLLSGRRPYASSGGCETYLSSTKVIQRDAPHASCRLLKRPFAASPDLSGIMHEYINGAESFCQRAFHSPLLTAWWKELVPESSSLACAKHRFASIALPLARVSDNLSSMISLCHRIGLVRGSAGEWASKILAHFSGKKALLLAMAAAAATSCDLTRSVDDEAMDISEFCTRVQHFAHSVQALFVSEKVLELPTYAKSICATLFRVTLSESCTVEWREKFA